MKIPYGGIKETARILGCSSKRVDETLRLQHNESVLVRCVTIMREHDKRAEMANFARCGCEFCKVLRYYEPPNPPSSSSQKS